VIRTGTTKACLLRAWRAFVRQAVIGGPRLNFWDGFKSIRELASAVASC